MRSDRIAARPGVCRLVGALMLAWLTVAWLAPAAPTAQRQPDGLRWVSVPGTQPSGRPWRAEFQMGCVPGDGACQSPEKPRHPVALTRAYGLLATEVTLGQFRAFAGATGHRTQAERDGWGFSFDRDGYVREDGLSWKAPGFFQEENHPVVQVSWDDAVAYCTWAAGRLPSEAEWEYAARGGVADGLFVWGSTADGIRMPRAANVADASAQPHFPWWAVFPNYRDGFGWTSPVGSFVPNGFGLFDMAGNAWEWTADWYGPAAYASSAAEDPRGPATARSRVVRGSSWGDEPVVLRISERSFQLPEHRSYFHGFRCARDEPAAAGD